MKAEIHLRLLIEAPPKTKRLLQKRECAYDIRLNELFRTVDRAIDMALRGEIHHITWTVLVEQSA